ncbi:MAG: glutamate--tRNA ligase [Gammaproteobacteria bacterium]|nr:glutamate--tRNA ligase [Gammaproteobacteria bacterium]
MSKPVRTRFAPSPTGYLHVGGVRTALFSWLFARHHQGQFILRIEDTDVVRSTSESVAAILDGMAWLGLEADEGPYYQSQRMDRYTSVAQELLDKGLAYRCQCSVERLDKVREEQMQQGLKPRYDGHCRHLNVSADVPHVIRLATPQTGEVRFDDMVYGEIVVGNQELDDLVLVRQDGMPTYNFAVVIDDWDMDISHVIRGDDHINNTPRQIHIYQALGAPMPIFAHLPMILGADGKRLSKRHGAVSVMSFKEEGYLPQAVLNYLVRLGWSHGDQEIFSFDEMIQEFRLENVSRSACAFDYEKLKWLNQHYLKTLDPAHTKDEWMWHMREQGFDARLGPSWEQLAPLQTPRFKTMDELVAQSHYFYKDFDLNLDELTPFKTPEVETALKALIARFESLSEWEAPVIMATIKEVVQEHGLKIPALGQPMRLLLTETLSSPSIDATLALLGQERAISRLKKFF